MEKMTKPEYKIGEQVISKLWFFYNICKIERAYWCKERHTWMYTIKAPGHIVKHCKQENELRDLDLHYRS
jgi:hypothetical protein